MRDNGCHRPIRGGRIVSSLLATQPTKDSGSEHLLMWCATNLDEPAIVRNVLSRIFGQDLGIDRIFPNPLFLANGHFSPSPKTSAYFGTRNIKKIASKGISYGGSALSPHTGGINVPAALQGVNSGYSTVRHLQALKRFATGANRQSKTLSAWLDMAIHIKERKGIRSAGSTVANLVPLIALAPKVSDTVAEGVSLGIELITDMISKAPDEALIARVAMEIHWRAHQELFMASHLSGSTGQTGVGPASNIFYEIFTRYGATAIFRSYDKSELVKEPAAWFALYDKLSL